MGMHDFDTMLNDPGLHPCPSNLFSTTPAEALAMSFQNAVSQELGLFAQANYPYDPNTSIFVAPAVPDNSTTP
jgi:hypothetical protein